MPRLDPAELMREHQRILNEFDRRKRDRVARYGSVRPIISAVWHGKRFVAVGGTLLSSETWKTVPDFLSDYIKSVLGGEWAKREIKAKPLEERHPMLQWYDSWCHLQQRNAGSKTKNGSYHGVKDGPSTAYLLLAYDLYLLADHMKLQARLVERLKHPQLFQGARHELAVATTCIRAGFLIEHEDEADKSTRHPELIATHQVTGQVIAVEAKSRHRSGVLGRPGGREETPKASVRRILNQALAKATQLPYAVFVDLNLPPSDASDVREIGWVKELCHEFGRPARSEKGQTAYNLVMFTNYPQHFGAEAAPNPASACVSVVSLNPRTPVRHPQALEALHHAAEQYESFPNWFDE